MKSTSLAERAYELAGSGSCTDLKDVRRKLKQEYFSALDIDMTLSGAATRKALLELCRSANVQSESQSES